MRELSIYGLSVYILSFGLQVLCLVVMCIALAKVRALRANTGVPASAPERKLAALEIAVGRLAEATSEAERLCFRLERLTERGHELAERPTEGTQVLTEDRLDTQQGKPSPSAGLESPRPRVAPQKVREKLGVVRRLSEGGASMEQICEQTGLSEPEARFVLGILGSGTAQIIEREETQNDKR